MLVHELLNISAINHPERIAVIHDDRKLSYQQLNTLVNYLAAHLLAQGIAKGDRIALIFENSIDYIISYYAAMRVGGIATPLNPGTKPDGLQSILRHLQPAFIIAGSRSERLLKATDLSDIGLRLVIICNPKLKWINNSFNVVSFEEATAEQQVTPIETIHTSDVASIIYTSGSTGEPKGVMLSHQNIVSNTKSICQYLQLSKDDIQMVVLPFFYVMGKSLLNTHIAKGGTVVINNRFMYPADVVHQMIEEEVTGFSGVPSTYAYLLNRSPLEKCKDHLHNLRYCSQAGGHMANSLKNQLRKALPEHTDIVIMYGATEASARLTYLDPNAFSLKIGSIGKPIPGVTVRIVDENAHEVPGQQEGELVASGPNIMLGYWNDSEGTKEVLDDLGYHTGDIGYRDKDGFLFINRRKDGLLKVGGHRVNPTEIEDFLMATEMIIETAVIGRPDDMLGTKLIAVVVPKENDLGVNKIHQLCLSELPKHKCPSTIITTRSLPKNASGKINRKKCMEIAMKADD